MVSQLVPIQKEDSLLPSTDEGGSAHTDIHRVMHQLASDGGLELFG